MIIKNLRLQPQSVHHQPCETCHGCQLSDDFHIVTDTGNLDKDDIFCHDHIIKTGLILFMFMSCFNDSVWDMINAVMKTMLSDTDMERCDVVAHAGLVDVDVRVPDQLVHNLMIRKVRGVMMV